MTGHVINGISESAPGLEMLIKSLLASKGSSHVSPLHYTVPTLDIYLAKLQLQPSVKSDPNFQYLLKKNQGVKAMLEHYSLGVKLRNWDWYLTFQLTHSERPGYIPLSALDFQGAPKNQYMSPTGVVVPKQNPIHHLEIFDHIEGIYNQDIFRGFESHVLRERLISSLPAVEDHLAKLTMDRIKYIHVIERGSSYDITLRYINSFGIQQEMALVVNK